MPNYDSVIANAVYRLKQQGYKEVNDVQPFDKVIDLPKKEEDFSETIAQYIADTLFYEDDNYVVQVGEIPNKKETRPSYVINLKNTENENLSETFIINNKLMSDRLSPKAEEITNAVICCLGMMSANNIMPTEEQLDIMINRALHELDTESDMTCIEYANTVIALAETRTGKYLMNFVVNGQNGQSINGEAVFTREDFEDNYFRNSINGIIKGNLKFIIDEFRAKYYTLFQEDIDDYYCYDDYIEDSYSDDDYEI